LLEEEKKEEKKGKRKRRERRTPNQLVSILGKELLVHFIAGHAVCHLQCRVSDLNRESCGVKESKVCELGPHSQL